MIPKKIRKEVKMMRAVGEMRSWVQHHFNSVHIYCRLVRIIPRSPAKKIVLCWEKTAIYSLMYTSD